MSLLKYNFLYLKNCLVLLAVASFSMVYAQNNLLIMNHGEPYFYRKDNSENHQWIISNSTKKHDIDAYFTKSDYYLAFMKEEEDLLKERRLKADSCLALKDGKKVAVCFKCLQPLDLKQQSIQESIKNLRENVQRLAIVLSNITTKSKSLENAQILIENGNFKQADALLDGEKWTLEAEKLWAKKGKTKSKRQSIAHQLDIKSDEFLVKASLKALTSYYPNRNDTAEMYFRKSIKYHEKVENLWTFANFLGLRISFYGTETDSVIAYYNRALAFAKTDELKGIFYNNLNVGNTNKENSKEKEANYLQAFNIYQQLSKTNTANIDPIWAVITSNLGNFYFENSVNLEGVNYFLQAEQYFLQAINIYKRLFKANPEYYGLEFHRTLIQLSQVYLNKKQDSEAEKYKLQAHNISESLSQLNPQKFEAQLADSYMNLGSFYFSRDRIKYPTVEKYYETGVSIYERLAEKNLEQYAHTLTSSLMYSMSGIYWLNKKKPEVEKSYLKAIKLLEQYNEKFPYRAEHSLTGARRQLADFYQRDKRHEAEKYYLAVLNFSENNSEAWASRNGEVARSAADLGVFYHITAQKMPEAEKYFQQALAIYEEGAKENPERFEYELGTTLYNFGLCYKAQNKWTQAEIVLTRALAIGEIQAKRYEPYERERIQRWSSLKELYETMLVAATTQTEKAEIADKLKKLLARQ